MFSRGLQSFVRSCCNTVLCNSVLVHRCSSQWIAVCHPFVQTILSSPQPQRMLHGTKQKIKIAALRMYTCCVERINYDEFFEKCQLPDTLNSWFLVTQLHVWMCLVRMKQEGRAGKYMCRYVVHSMWEDVEQRGKVMGIDSVTLKESLKAMTENFYAAIFGYDEMQYLDSLNGEDLLLSGEVKWRPLLETDPQSILKPVSPTYNDEGL
ncbi:ubiquinol-cytochrome-c reductase complex assembly factor 1 isoform X3 [Protopterus annectens]|uniref:ubiquinol-cytochrome-c reductase complex assembly factor 1 isoform X3 n=1 Tax=Protopterus annectens TaxID=7888 RepID=UPI001CFA5958|nr:ubiquinol-cytochrome-c reductase complex assembly factor 1 isoform X3 [Protopterus annectens]